MTVQTTTSRADYTGNGSTTAFTVPFYFLDSAHLIVYRTQISTGVVTTLVITTDYSVTGAGVSSGGTVTCVVAPTTDQRISILRNVPLTQLTHYVENDPFPAATHETALDKLTMEVQQLDEANDRALMLNPVTTGVSATLPTPQANYLLAWNASGTGVQNVAASTLTTITGTASGFNTQTFNGDATTVAFTLSDNPGTLANLEVFVSGVRQKPSTDYTFSGTTLTFTSAPPTGTANVFVRWGTTLGVATVADSSVTPVKMANSGYELGPKNRLINSSFLVDQRNIGANQTITAGAALAYTADRWWAACTGANVTGRRYLVSSPFPNSYYQFTGATSNTGVQFGQRIEYANCYDLASTTVTLTARMVASAPITVTWAAYGANSGDSFGTLASPTKTLIATGTFNVTAVDANYSAAFVTNAFAANGIEVIFSVAALGNAATLAFYNVQLERGGTFTQFEYRNVAAETLACQRYYWKSFSGGALTQFPTVYGYASAASQNVGQAISFPTPMRGVPTVTVVGTWSVTNCAQPLTAGVTRNGFTVYASSSAAGTVTFYPGSSSTYLENTASEL